MNNNSESSLIDFEIIQEIGKGAFGNVYKVKRIQDGEIYAMKKVPMEKLKPKEKENSLNEIRILASIHHPNVISYKDAFYDHDTYNLCIVMEYADCGDLENKINSYIKNKVYMNEKEIVTYFIQMLKGLKTLHDKKIIHRDIKAANVFLFNPTTVKIGDLNVSKVYKSGVQFTQTGTPYYSSPEVWCDKPYDYKADIWSLGCLLYEMLTLKAPFRGTTMKAVFDKVMKGVYDPIPGFYSKTIENVLKISLQKNPDLRPTCDQLLNFFNEKFSHLKFFSEIKSVDHLRNDRDKMNKTENRNNISIENDKSPLLNTIKIPKIIFNLNKIMPRTNRSLWEEKKDVSCIIQSKKNLNEAFVPEYNNKTLQDRGSLDLSEFYQKQGKLIDELLKDSPKKEKSDVNSKNEKSVDLTNIKLNNETIPKIKNEEKLRNDPILSLIHKPIMIKNKIIHNLKRLQRNEKTNEIKISPPEIKILDIDDNILEQSFMKQINKKENIFLNLKSKISPVIKPNSMNNNNSRCISANSNHLRNNSNNIRRVFNQDLSYVRNDNSFLQNVSALPAIVNSRQNSSNKEEKPIKLKIPSQLMKIENKNINEELKEKKYISDKNILEIKNINGIQNDFNSKCKAANYHYNNNYNKFSRLVLPNKKSYEQRPFSHLNGQRFNLIDEAKFIKEKNEGFYKILGVNITSSSNEIRSAYRKLAKNLHPDKGGEQAKFQELQEAYDVLSDPKKKEIYDNYGEEGLKNSNDNTSDPFDILFKRRKNKTNIIKKCKSHKVQLTITLIEAYNGVQKSVSFSRRIICQGCKGTGANNLSGKFSCPKCKGKGLEIVLERFANILFQREQKCAGCNGEGEVIKEKCGYCQGEKVLFDQNEVKLRIAKGIGNGYCFEFKEVGDEYPGFENGDLIVEIVIEKDSLFIRENANLICNVRISFVQALTGVKLYISHLNGKKILIQSKKGEVIKPKTQKCVSYLGMPYYENPYIYGDLIIRFEIDLPDHIDNIKTKILNEILKNTRINLDDNECKDCQENYMLMDYTVEKDNIKSSKARGFFMNFEEEKEESNINLDCNNQ